MSHCLNTQQARSNKRKRDESDHDTAIDDDDAAAYDKDDAAETRNDLVQGIHLALEPGTAVAVQKQDERCDPLPPSTPSKPLMLYQAPDPPPVRVSALPPFYGYEDTAKLCARFLRETFQCPDPGDVASRPVPSTVTDSATPASVAAPGKPSLRVPPLQEFVAFALFRTQIHEDLAIGGLLLLQRLKDRFPKARGSSGHRLFITAFMLAAKNFDEAHSYSNKSWGVVAGWMFSLKEINQMEREMCQYLAWKFAISAEQFHYFKTDWVRRMLGDGADSASVPAFTPCTAQ